MDQEATEKAAPNPMWEAFLAARCLDERTLAALSDPAHKELAGTPEAVALLKAARSEGWPTVVMPDFDCDGVTAGAVLFAGLSELGLDARLWCPTPSRGYGLRPVDVEEALAQNPGARLIVTCDVGVTATEAVAAARARGASVVVTDHHRPGPALPAADVVVDPWCEPEGGYGHRDICGAHVAFQLVMSLARALGDPAAEDRCRALEALAGIGTVADGMPVLYENRALVASAVGRLRALVPPDGSQTAPGAVPPGSSAALASALEGLSALLGALRDAGKLDGPEAVDERTVSFYLAPAVNSVKRLELPSSESFDVLFAPDKAAAARNILERNAQRKALEQEALSRLDGFSQPLAPYVWLSDAPAGVLGLLAQRKAQETGLPALAVARTADGRWHGSGRSPAWYPARPRLDSQGLYAHGHDCAFGFRAASDSELARAASFLAADVAASVPEGGVPQEPVDVAVQLGAPEAKGAVAYDPDTAVGFVREVAAHGPWGRGLERPRCSLVLGAAAGDPSVMGQAKDHLRVRLPGGGTAVAFGFGHLLEQVRRASRVEMRGEWEENRWRGRSSVQFMAKEVEVA